MQILISVLHLQLIYHLIYTSNLCAYPLSLPILRNSFMCEPGLNNITVKQDCNSTESTIQTESSVDNLIILVLLMFWIPRPLSQTLSYHRVVAVQCSYLVSNLFFAQSDVLWKFEFPFHEDSRYTGVWKIRCI